MKCPKCHYISFDDVTRCRNCGYDLTLVKEETPGPELPLRDGSPDQGPSGDLPLTGPPPAGSAAPQAGRAARAASAPAAGLDLPLFDRPVPGVDDTPLLRTAAPPRPPLAVRRATGDTPRPSVTPEAGGVARRDAGAHADAGRRTPLHAYPPPRPEADVRSALPGARPLPRVGAALVDAGIVGAIDYAVLSFTLRLTGLDFRQIDALPLAPLVVFLLLLNGGYLVGFTAASGQTIGKMLMGVRVVGEMTPRVALGNAVVRSAGIVLTLLSLGVGYLPVLVGRDRRTLHDRLAGTRVVSCRHPRSSATA